MVYLSFIAFIMFFGYVLGSLNFSILISNFFFKSEIRNLGSGNAGATNMLRNFGKLAGLFTFLFDFLKGFFSVFLVNFWCGIFINVYKEFSDFYKSEFIFMNFEMCALFAVVVGHIFPLFYKFKGGKGISTFAGALLAYQLKVFVIVFLVFLFIFLILKIVSISSICATISFVFVNFLFLVFDFRLAVYFNFKMFVFIFLKSVLLAILIIVKHKLNIIRLMSGKEPKIGR